MPTKNRRRGSAILLVLFLITAIGIVVSSSFLIGNLMERTKYASQMVSRTENGAESTVQILTDQVAVLAAMKLGNITQADIDSLNANLPPLPSQPGITIDLANTGYRVTAVRDTTPEGTRLTIPHDQSQLAVWTHQPRLSFEGIAPIGGLVASRSMEITVFATFQGNRGSRRTVAQTVGVTQVPPYQAALYTAGDAEMRANFGGGNLLGGMLRVDGGISMGGTYAMRYVGGIEATNTIDVAPGAAQTVTSMGASGLASNQFLTTITRSQVETDPVGTLSTWGGRVRISPAVGGLLPATRMQTAETAGFGECPVDDPTCGGRSGFGPGIRVQHITSGNSSTFETVCGYAYGAPGNTACIADAQLAFSYLPWPFAGSQPAGLAVQYPAGSGVYWRGLFPDSRRESRCYANLGPGKDWWTARCPTNAYGFTLDLSRLPEVPGGLVFVQKASSAVPGSNPSGAQEVLLIKNARALGGPLTIVSQIPVFIQGNFNTTANAAFNGPPPAMIDAPRVTILPDETPPQLRTSTVWDYVSGTQWPLQAMNNVTVFAVLRTGYCRSIGSAYYGGTWEAMPSVLGDWTDASLRIVGSVQGYDETSRGSTYCSSFAAPMNVAAPGGVETTQPLSRNVLFDERLYDPSFQPPGSWTAENTPPSGWSPSRTRARQANAFGGITALRITKPLAVTAFNSIPARVNIPAAPSTLPMPTPPPMLPIAPTARFTYTTSALSAAFDGSTSDDGNSPPLSYAWSFGDGATATGIAPSHSYANGDDYTVSLTVTNAIGRTHTYSRIVSVNRPPVADFSWSPVPGRIQEDIAFYAGLSTDPDASANAYQPLVYTFDFGDGSATTTGTNPTFVHRFAALGSYNVTLTVNDQRGGTNSVTKTVTVENRSPVACFTPTNATVYRNQILALSGGCSSDPDFGQTLTYSWSFGDLTTGSGVSTTHAWSNQGVHTVTLTVNDGFGGTSSASSTVTVLNKAPVLSWTINPNPAFVNTAITFDASASTDPEGDPITYSWSYGDGSTGTGAASTHAYTTPGTYTVTLTGSDGLGGVTSDTRDVTVPNRNPTASFSATPNPAYNDQTITFDGSASTDPDGQSLQYSWNWGDASAPTAYSSTATASHLYTTVGIYTATLTVRDPTGGTGPISKTITIANRDPAACVTPTSASVYRGQVQSFNASCSTDPDGEALTYSFDWGDGSVASAYSATATASHTWSSVGTFTASVTAKDPSGATTSTPISISVYNRGPTSGFSANPGTTLNRSQAVVLTSLGSDPDGDALTCAWTLGDGRTATGCSVTTSWNNEGSYSVALTVTDVYGASDTRSAVFTIQDRPPTACFTPASATVVIGQSVSFSASCSSDPDGDALTYSWAFGDLTSAAGQNVTKSYSAKGSYTVTLTVSDGHGRSASTTGIITVANRIPVISSVSATPATVYRGQTVTSTITASDPDGDVLKYYWAWDGTNVAGGGSVGEGYFASNTRTHAYATLGTFEIWGYASDGNMQDRKIVTVSVVDRTPTACFTPVNQTVYRAQVIAFNATCSSDSDGDALTYSWSFGDGTSSSSAAPAKAYSIPGTYTVTLTVNDGFGGTNATTTQVTVLNRAPGAAFTWSPSTIYINTSVTFNGTTSSDPDGDGLTYAWDLDNNGTTDATGATPTTSFSSPGARTVKLTVTDPYGSSNSRLQTITVTNRNPIATFTYSPSNPSPSTTITFNASGSSDPDGQSLSYSWTFGDLTTGSGVSPTKRFSNPGTYNVQLTVTDGAGGTSSATIAITVVNRAPTISGTTASPNPAQKNQAVTISVSATDPDGDAVAYYVDYGDGTNTGTNGGSWWSTGAFTHAYSSAGTFTITYYARDVAGAQVSSTRSITAINSAPVVSSVTLSATTINRNTPLTATITATDANSDALGYYFYWNVYNTNGIGYLGEGYFASNQRSFAGYAKPGTYTVRGYAYDGTDQTYLEKTVTVVNRAPTGLSISASPNPGTSSTATTFTGSGSDPDGDAVICSWNWGDLTTATGCSASHTYTAAGTYAVQLTLTDSYGAASSTSLSYTVKPQACTALGVTGCDFWMDAQQETTIPNGQWVTAATDFSGNGHTIRAASCCNWQPPIFTDSGINGRNSFYFDGSRNFWPDLMTGDYLANTPFTYFVVVQTFNTFSGLGTLGRSSGAALNLMTAGDNGDTRLSFWFNDLNASGLNSNSGRVLAFRVGNPADQSFCGRSIWTNNAQMAASDGNCGWAPATGDGKFEIGGWSSGPASIIANIGEIVVYKRALTNAQMATVINSLQTRWGL